MAKICDRNERCDYALRVLGEARPRLLEKCNYPSTFGLVGYISSRVAPGDLAGGAFTGLGCFAVGLVYWPLRNKPRTGPSRSIYLWVGLDGQPVDGLARNGLPLVWLALNRNPLNGLWLDPRSLKFELPRGLLPLANVVEVGFVESTGYMWIVQQKQVEHQFKMISKDTAVKGYIEKGKIKKLEGVKAKELKLWPPEIIDSPPGKIHFKSLAGITKSFPVEAFAAGQ
ncbi:hypothetical protein NL676_016140 [Syzygium grande]|nr:hypothetical protein NL676_016140 [Syzygium grande]